MFKPLRQSNPLLKIGNSVIELAAPKNISALWSYGSLAGVCLVTQIVTGLFLAIYFASHTSLAFDSAVYISRDVNYGWLIRAIHANRASIFFLCLYIHTGRGIYYGSYQFLEVWRIGVTILLITIITAFLGYVLPWGQISYWAATVITNLISAIPYIGNDVVIWLWGGFSVRNATLVRFYAFHFLFPFVLAALSIVHILYLHQEGSRNPLGLNRRADTIKFHPYFTIKDLFGFAVLWLILGVVVLFNPNILIDAENFIPANPLVTPTHIQPEWYFLPIYAILRSIPNKLGGVIGLIMSIAILYTLPLYIKPTLRSNAFNVLNQLIFWALVFTFVVLMWIGRKPVEAPYEGIGQIFTFIYFLLFFLIPLANLTWKNIIKLWLLVQNIVDLKSATEERVLNNLNDNSTKTS